MMYLLDTNVVSEFRKAKTDEADRHVKEWAKDIPAASMYLSVICILELERGTLLMERRDTSQGAMLRSWLENHVLPAFAGRIYRSISPSRSDALLCTFQILVLTAMPLSPQQPWRMA